MCESDRAVLVRAQLVRQSNIASRTERTEALAVLIKIAMECVDAPLQDAAATFLESFEGLCVIHGRIHLVDTGGRVC